MFKHYNVFVVGIIVVLALTWHLFFNNNLGTFEITSFSQDINNKETLNYLTWSKSNNAKKYIINVYHEDSLIKTYETTDTKLLINDLNIQYNETMTFEIVASNSQKKKTVKSNAYPWLLPTIKLDNYEIIYEDKKLDSEINININKTDLPNDLHIKIERKSITLYDDIFKDKLINFNKQIKDFDNIYGNYEVLLYIVVENNNLILHKQTININTPHITDLMMIAPLNNSEIPYENYKFEFSGGTNADMFIISIQDDNHNMVIDDIELTNKSLTIISDLLKPSTNYHIKVKAFNLLQAERIKEFNYTFKTAKEKTVAAINPTQSSGNIGSNRPIRLRNNTVGAKIYYTLDGSNPSCQSTEYKGNIYINKDITIKAIACKDGMYNSDILTLNYKSVEKQKAIYLSPSNQNQNIGVNSVGFTNEMEMMNKVADYIQNRLEKNSIIVYRNRSDMDLSEMVIDSSTHDVDMHLAIHSNAFNTYERGVETWIYDKNLTEPYKIATKIQNALMKIYTVSNYNRGIKESASMGGLRENHPLNVSNGVLVEVAFHDNYQDAKWIVQNIELIGNTIADAVISYLNGK